MRILWKFCASFKKIFKKSGLIFKKFRANSEKILRIKKKINETWLKFQETFENI